MAERKRATKVVRNANGWFDAVDDEGNIISADFTEEADAILWVEGDQSNPD